MTLMPALSPTTMLAKATAMLAVLAMLISSTTAQSVATIGCGYNGATQIVNGLYVPYYLNLPRSSSASGNTAVRFTTCSTQFDSSICVGSEWVDDAHTTTVSSQ